jgi:BON domain
VEPGSQCHRYCGTAHNGAVTLTGFVRSDADKYEAESAAKRVAGVVAVANDLEVRTVRSARRRVFSASASARSMRSRKDAFSAASASASAHSSGAPASFLLCGISASCNCLTALPGYWIDNCWWPQLVASGGLSQFAVVDGELGQRNDVRTLAPAADGALWVGTFGGGLARHLLPLIIDLQSTAPTAILNLIVHDLLPTLHFQYSPSCRLGAARITSPG